MTAATQGMRIEPQNLLTPTGPDPTALADRVFADGMDHHHFMVRPRFMNQIMQGVARNLAGLGTLPARPPDAPAKHDHIVIDVLIVGAGRSGGAAAHRLRAAGIPHSLVDRLDPPGLASPTPVHYSSTGVFGLYPAEHRVAAMSRDTQEVLRTFEPRHVVLATGATEPLLPFENNDLPGVVAAGGLLKLMRRTGRPPAGPVVVVGDELHARPVAQAFNAKWFPAQEVSTVHGGTQVEAIEVNGKTHDCRIIAVAPPPAAASDLARQAGAKVRWNGTGFPVLRDASGRVETKAPWTLWAAGEVAGVSADDAEADGERVAAALLQVLRGGGS